MEVIYFFCTCIFTYLAELSPVKKFEAFRCNSFVLKTLPVPNTNSNTYIIVWQTDSSTASSQELFYNQFNINDHM